MVERSQSHPNSHPHPHPQQHHHHGNNPNQTQLELESAAKAYLENNVRYYLQNVNNTNPIGNCPNGISSASAINNQQSTNKNAAADFIARATKLSKSTAITSSRSHSSVGTSYSEIIAKLQPIPSLLSSTSSSPIKKSSFMSPRMRSAQEHPLGKVKVILRVTNNGQHEEAATNRPFLKIDNARRQITLYDPTLLSSYEDNQRPAAPKMFAFDAILNGGTGNGNQSLELSKASLPELIDAVMNGNDAVLFALGKTGTRETMLATDGLMVYAINWLFGALKASKRRFAIKCSAAEINHNGITDLMAGHHPSSSSTSSSSVAAKNLMKNSTSVISGLREISCISAKRAAHCLDIATNYYNGNYRNYGHNQENLIHSDNGSSTNSLLFTLHLYQYTIITSACGKNTVVGGRSKLHLFDLCSSTKNLHNVLLAIFNGQKHIPNKDSKLTTVLKECLSSMLVWSSIVANISNSETSYLDTLSTCQFVTRIHRSRMIFSGRSRLRRLRSAENTITDSPKDHDSKLNSESESAINCYTSSSEHSMDTVIFCGKSNDHMTDISTHHKISHQTVLTQTKSSPSSPLRTSLQSPSKSDDHEHRKAITSEVTVSSVTAHRKDKETKLSDELWIDGPKRTRKKKIDISAMNWSKELWVDGPNASDCTVDDGHAINYNEEKKQRIQKWIQQNTKQIWTNIRTKDNAAAASVMPSPSAVLSPTRGHEIAPCITCLKQQIPLKSLPETTEVSCQTDPSGNCTPSDSEWSCDGPEMSFDSDDPLRILSNEDLFGIGAVGECREAMSDCCDKAHHQCYYGSGHECDTDEHDDCLSEPITEPPKQLKLEQFLQQLSTITMPNLHHNYYQKHRNRRDNYRSLRHPDGASDQNIGNGDYEWTRTEFAIDGQIAKDKETKGGHKSRPESIQSPPPPPPASEMTLISGPMMPFSPNHAVLPTSPMVNRLLGSGVSASAPQSPSKSSLTRKQQKLEQQLKRNTTSTTTSGHGTTSEGESSSVVKDHKSSTSSPGHRSYRDRDIVQRQPASSGYESTIHDDESDRELVARRPEPVMVGQNGSEQLTPVKMRKKKKLQEIDDREKRTSGGCSFLCCRFMDIYH